jgi:hypothetical protein
MNHNRYEGKPLKRLLERYVLWAIGEISESDLAVMHEITPKLREVYNIDGTWQDIISSVMRFPEGMPSEIRNIWHRNRDLALESDVILGPQMFAEMFVDDNFPV